MTVLYVLIAIALLIMISVLVWDRHRKANEIRELLMEAKRVAEAGMKRRRAEAENGVSKGEKE